MKKLYLFGAGSGSREVLLLIERINSVSPEWEVIGFVDEDPNLIGTEVDEIKVFSPDQIKSASDSYGVCGIMDPKVRQRMIEENIEARGLKLPTIVAPDVVLPRDFAAGPGTIIMPATIVSFDIQVGKGVFVLWGSAIGHHARLGEYATILSFAKVMAGCRVGARATVGAHATLNLNVSIGSDAFVGIGSTIFRDIDEGKQVVSIPRQVETDRR